MTVYTIDIKGYPVSVVKMQVAELDTNKCSKKFNSYNLSPETVVLVVCDPISGIPVLHGKRLTIYPSSKLEENYYE